MGERTLHLVDEKQYREVFVPSVSGDEDALNELLEWASLLATGWEPRSQAYALVKESRGQWKGVIEGHTPSGEPPPRTQDFAARILNVAFGALSAYRRQAFLLPRGLAFSTLGSIGLTSLSQLLTDAGKLLDGVSIAPPWMRESARALPGGGPSAGLYLPKEKAPAFLKAVRSDLAGHARHLEEAGLDAEAALATLVAASREAKETGTGILELDDAMQGPRGPLFPHESLRSHALGNLPAPVIREVRKALGSTWQPPGPLLPPAVRPAPAPPPAASEPVVPYSPAADYQLGQRVTHPRFGAGEVKNIPDRNKVLIAFASGERTLAQNATAAPAEVPAPSELAPPVVGVLAVPAVAPTSPAAAAPPGSFVRPASPAFPLEPREGQ